jgi:pyrophosphatase PpaX
MSSGAIAGSTPHPASDSSGGPREPTILFDLDGTLIDTIELIVAAAQYAFASRPGPAPTELEIRRTIGRPLVTQFGPWLVGDTDLPFLVAKYREHQLEHHDRLTTVYPGIPEAIASLHAAGCAMGIVTSKVGFMAERALVHVGLREYMQVLIASDSTTKHKPDPEPVLVAMERLGARPLETIFVGDSPYDMMAAVAAGVRPVGVAWGAFEAEELVASGAAVVLRTVGDLRSLLSSAAPTANPRA